MGAFLTDHFSFPFHGIFRRFFAEVSLSVCASLVVVAILASGAPRWPTSSPAIERPKLTARVDSDPQLAGFIESAALAHLGPGRSETLVRPALVAKVRLAALAPEQLKSRPRLRSQAQPMVLPPPRPADLSAPIPVSASPQMPEPSTFALGAQLFAGLARAIPFRQSLFAQAGSIGSKITGLIPGLR